tara:strand:- start:250 stop:636 length:387 start_codon:yes stop_codon:yes gene_type:complete
MMPEFTTPNGCRFTIPDQWWHFADMHLQDWRGLRFYPCNPRLTVAEVQVLPLILFKPPMRSADKAPFKKSKMLPILFALTSDEATLPPIEAAPLHGHPEFRYRIINGFHRYYVSAAIGYPSLPAVVAV